jgi:hypothetical protein
VLVVVLTQATVVLVVDNQPQVLLVQEQEQQDKAIMAVLKVPTIQAVVAEQLLLAVQVVLIRAVEMVVLEATLIQLGQQ